MDTKLSSVEHIHCPEANTHVSVSDVKYTRAVDALVQNFSDGATRVLCPMESDSHCEKYKKKCPYSAHIR
ncbi:hypothetical protein M0P48_01945 [Candidatus Gracilibacteria bacterium]|nr:hypothetical protein [Candidatus Gracilibacteria bacterium]